MHAISSQEKSLKVHPQIVISIFIVSVLHFLHLLRYSDINKCLTGTRIAWLSQAGLSVIDVRREGPAVPSNMVTLRAVNREMKKIREQKWEKNSMITA